MQIARPKLRLEGDLAVYADHLAAVIRDEDEKIYVDYSGELARAHTVRAITDVEAVAHYFTNRGYERAYAAKRAATPIPWEEVALDFDLSVKVVPESARGWNNLGVARARLADDDGATEAYLRALEIDERLTSTHLNLVMLYLRQGALRSARAHLESAERLDPDNPQLAGLREALETAFERLAQGRERS